MTQHTSKDMGEDKGTNMHQTGGKYLLNNRPFTFYTNCNCSNSASPARAAALAVSSPNMVWGPFSWQTLSSHHCVRPEHMEDTQLPRLREARAHGRHSAPTIA